MLRFGLRGGAGRFALDRRGFWRTSGSVKGSKSAGLRVEDCELAVDREDEDDVLDVVDVELELSYINMTNHNKYGNIGLLTYRSLLSSLFLLKKKGDTGARFVLCVAAAVLRGDVLLEAAPISKFGKRSSS